MVELSQNRPWPAVSRLSHRTWLLAAFCLGRVYTAAREYLLMYRFSDAVRELDANSGEQVHRPYWVNKNAIAFVSPRVKKFKINLINGVEIPVSVPCHAGVKELARANRLMVRG